MDEWTRAMLTFALGAASPLLVRLGELFITRKQSRDDRRGDFQVKTMHGLQDAALKLRNIGAAVGGFRDSEEHRTGTWSKFFDNGQHKDLIGALGQMEVHRVRTADARTRDLAKQYYDAVAASIVTDSKERADNEWQKSGSLFHDLNERVGEVLRSL